MHDMDADERAQLWDEMRALNRMAYYSAPYEAHTTQEALTLQWDRIVRKQEAYASAN